MVASYPKLEVRPEGEELLPHESGAHGVAADRIAPVGVGEIAPVASNDTPEGRAQNRRVDVVLIE
jgi:flagellar motor protein MotB